MEQETLREARIRKRWSQAEAAAAVGVGVATWRRWETGVATPQPYHQRSISSAIYDTTPEKLLVDFNQRQSTKGRGLRTEEYEVSNRPRIFIASNPITCLWNLAHQPYSHYDTVQCSIRQTIKDSDAMNANNKNYQITRREVLSALATLPMITLQLQSSGAAPQPSHYGDALAHIAASIEGCEELRKSNNADDLRLAFDCASTYLPTLDTIARTSSFYRKESLSLAAQCALLKTLLGWHCIGTTETIQYAKDAVFYGKESGNIAFQLSAYVKLATAYDYDRKPTLALTTAEETESLLQEYTRATDTQPLHSSVYGSVHKTLAIIQAKNGRSPDAAWGKASEIMPDNENYAFMEFTPSKFLIDTGIIYCYQKKHAKVMEALEQRIDPKTGNPKSPLSKSELGRLKTINIMALSSLKEKNRDMEQTIHFFVMGIDGAKAFQSEQRFNEALDILRDMEIVWPDEPRVIELHDLTKHW